MGRRVLVVWLLLLVGVAAVLYGFFNVPAGSPLRRFGSGCIGCHLSLPLRGDVAAGFSKGVHPVNQRVIGSPESLLSAKSCLPCHAREHQQWKASAHGRALTGVIFRTALARDRKDWCLNCHAPLWQPDKQTVSGIADHLVANSLYAEGVNCAVCHVRGEKIYGSRALPKSADNFHPVYAEKNFGKGEFCAGCHQFNFTKSVEPVVEYESSPAMQDTVAEHSRTASAAAGQGCSDCHFTAGDHSLHQSATTDMRSRITASFAVAGRARGSYQLRAGVRVPNLGHAFPTGDLFRILSIYVYNDAGEELLRYDFRKEVRVVDRHLISDTTLFPGSHDSVGQRTLHFQLKQFPARCLVTYRLQGAIEHELLGHLPLTVLRRNFYDGPCTSVPEQRAAVRG